VSAETLINSTLLADVPVRSAVGVDMGSPIDLSLARIYPDFLSQEIVLPGIVLQRAASEYVTTIHSGDVVAARIAMDVWCMAATRIGAETLADLVETALPSGGFRVIDRRPDFDPETRTYAAIVTGEIWI
jgi:hypothetical protein